MVTDENGRNHCNCKYCGGKPKLVHGLLSDFIQCDDCQTSFSNWEEYDSIMDNFQDRVVKVSDIAKNTDINNWDHPYGISFKKLNEIPPVKIATEIVEEAYWLPSEKNTVKCSKCGFQVENHRAVELGENNEDYIEVKYHRCPICEARMHIRKKGN
jgi:hypothetical protein